MLSQYWCIAALTRGVSAIFVGARFLGNLGRGIFHSTEPPCSRSLEHSYQALTHLLQLNEYYANLFLEKSLIELFAICSVPTTN